MAAAPASRGRCCRVIRKVWLPCFNTRSSRGMENYHRIVRYMTALAAQAIPHSAWYLSIVGILPSAQGRGLGATLLAGTLAEASHAHVPCYLETFTPRNLRFYERLGFFVGSRRTANPPRVKSMW